MQIGPASAAALYDSGADISCMSEKEFRKIPVDKRPVKITGPRTDSCFSAGGTKLQVTGIYNLPISILGRKTEHPFRVIKGLNESVILGADFINKHLLLYDPKFKRVRWRHEKEWEISSLRATKEIVVPEYSSRLMKIRLEDGAESSEQVIAEIFCREEPYLVGGPGLIQVDALGCSLVEVFNTGPEPVVIARGQEIGNAENVCGQAMTHFQAEVVNDIAEKQWRAESSARKKIPVTEEFRKMCKLKVPAEYEDDYRLLLAKHRQIFSLDKNDIGYCDTILHRLFMKTEEPVYVKQFKIPEAHQHYLQEQVRDWLRLGIIQPSRSRYNSPVFLVEKKDGTQRVVQDFRSLNANTYVDKYSMKDVQECISEIGRAGSTIFTTLDLTSGFWQMALEPKSRPYTAFTVPGMGQFEWKVVSMGLASAPSAFQRLVELVVKGIANVVVYIDDLIIHSRTHEEHLRTLDAVFTRLASHNLRVNLKKCDFGSSETSYLGFRLSKDGIFPGTDKLKAVRDARPPENVKQIRQFLGLCNFFRGHIQNFAQITSPLTHLTRKDSGWKRGKLPENALRAFRHLQSLLCSQPVLAYPRSDRQYALITDASFGDENTAGGLGAILTQMDDKGRFYVIAYASRKLQKYEQNYTPFLLEMQAAIFGMETFEVHLKGRHFKLFTDHKPLEKLGKVHTKTLNRLQQMMNLYSFEVIYKKGDEMPADFLSRNAVDAIKFDLGTYAREQNKDYLLRGLRLYLLNKVLPDNNKIAKLIYNMSHDCFVLNGVVWKRLGISHQHRSVLLVPQHLIPDILHEAHGHLLAGHFGVSKTKQRLLQSYYWVNMEKDITEHLRHCDKCQLTKGSKMKPELLSPLPQCTEPNQRVHADLFGPLKTANGDKKFILCITDAFTKYVELVVLPNKEALTMSSGIFNHWICRFGLPLEIVTDQGKEFNNKMADHLFSELNIRHSTTSSYHPQCNSQAEVCNKTIAKYLADYVDDSTLNWEHYMPAMMFAYNTSFHRSIQATPFSLTYGLEARLPSFFAPDFRRLHDPDNGDGTLLEQLRRAREMAVANNLLATDKQKEYFDRTATHHDFHEGQFVLLNDFNFLNRNRKLAPKFSGPFKILRVKSPHNVELLLANGRKIVVNVARIKPYFGSTSSHLTFHTDDATATVDGSMTSASKEPQVQFAPPTLTPVHTRKPGRPCKQAANEERKYGRKVLSPSSTVSFSKKGREINPSAARCVQNETEMKILTEPGNVSARTHQMRTRSRKEENDAIVSKIVQANYYTQLNNIIRRSYHCVLRRTGKEKEDWLRRKKRRHFSIDRSKAAKAFGDPYIYSDYLEADIVEPKQQVHIPPFNDIVGHGYVEDHDGDDNVNNGPAGERRDFDFDDLVPILEDDEDEYDLETDFHRFEADAGYLDEGEIEVSVPAEQQPAPGNFPPFVDEEENTPAPRLRLRIPRGRVRHDILEWVSGSAGEPRGASLKEQTAYLSNLLDEIDRYTSKAEVTQRKVRGRDPEYQRLVQIEIRKGAEELQDQLTRAERILDPIAISNARLDRTHRRRPGGAHAASSRRPPSPRPAPLPPENVQPQDGDGNGWGFRTRSRRAGRSPPTSLTPARRTRNQDPTGQESRRGTPRH